MQIVGRGLDGHMPHVEGQFRQAGLDIGPFLIPADERLNSKAVPEIMNARPSASFILDASVFKKLIDCKLKSRVTVVAKLAAITVAQKRRFGISRESLAALAQIALQFARAAGGQRHQTRLVELRFPDSQHGSLFFKASHCQTQHVARCALQWPWP